MTGNGEEAAAELQLCGGRDNHKGAGVASKTTDKVLAVTYDNADWFWKDCAMRAMTWLAELGQPFDAYDLTLLGVPDPDDHHRWGAVFRTAATSGLIEPVGFAPSGRLTAGGSIARVWRGVVKSDELDATG